MFKDLSLARAQKAYGSAVAAAGPLLFALQQDGLTLGECVAVAGAALAAFVVTWALPNKAGQVVRPASPVE
jgi:hypothetical protein